MNNVIYCAKHDTQTKLPDRCEVCESERPQATTMESKMEILDAHVLARLLQSLLRTSKQTTDGYRTAHIAAHDYYRLLELADKVQEPKKEAVDPVRDMETAFRAGFEAGRDYEKDIHDRSNRWYATGENEAWKDYAALLSNTPPTEGKG